MVSTSSATNIKNRTKLFCDKIKEWKISGRNDIVFDQIKNHLDREYEMIPQKERIAKGTVYISKYVAKEIFLYLNSILTFTFNDFIEFIKKSFTYGEKNNSLLLKHFSLLILSEYLSHHPDKFHNIIPLIEKYANHEDWTIRETITHTIKSGLKKNRKITLIYLSKLSENENENLRRLAAESLRPTSEIKWLRDTQKNKEILKILSKMKKDPSIYVRKAVGNNLKDQSKYMPELILNLADRWIKESNISVRDDLASEDGLNQEEKRLIWTLKQSLRWIRNRNPEFRVRLQNILGKYYVLYFDEKRNRFAKPNKD